MAFIIAHAKFKLSKMSGLDLRSRLGSRSSFESYQSTSKTVPGSDGRLSAL